MIISLLVTFCLASTIQVPPSKQVYDFILKQGEIGTLDKNVKSFSGTVNLFTSTDNLTNDFIQNINIIPANIKCQIGKFSTSDNFYQRSGRCYFSESPLGEKRIFGIRLSEDKRSDMPFFIFGKTKYPNVPSPNDNDKIFFQNALGFSASDLIEDKYLPGYPGSKIKINDVFYASEAFMTTLNAPPLLKLRVTGTEIIFISGKKYNTFLCEGKINSDVEMPDPFTNVAIWHIEGTARLWFEKNRGMVKSEVSYNQMLRGAGSFYKMTCELKDETR